MDRVSDWSFLIPYYISSLVYSIGSVAYVTSLATGEVSLVTPINSLNSLFLLLLLVIFLQSYEVYNTHKIFCGKIFYR